MYSLHSSIYLNNVIIHFSLYMKCFSSTLFPLTFPLRKSHSKPRPRWRDWSERRGAAHLSSRLSLKGSDRQHVTRVQRGVKGERRTDRDRNEEKPEKRNERKSYNEGRWEISSGWMWVLLYFAKSSWFYCAKADTAFPLVWWKNRDIW